MGCFTTKYKVNRDELTLELNGKLTTFKKGDIIYRDHAPSFLGQPYDEVSIMVDGRLKSLGCTDKGIDISNKCINLSDLED